MQWLERHIHWLAIALAALVLIVHNYYVQPWTLDDAFISFRYAENFAAGNNFVYNAGEYVEGYTTFLWVFLLGVGNAFGLPTPVLAKVLGMGFAIGCLILLGNASLFLPTIERGESASAVMIAGTTGIFTVWAMSGMEVPMVAFLVTLTVLLHIRFSGRKSLIAVGLCAALTTMVRPEFVLLFAVLLADRLCRDRRGAAWFVLGFGGLYAPYFLWRLVTYGWLFPNTFYCKVGASTGQLGRGFDYLGLFCWPALLLLALLVVVLVGRSRIPAFLFAYFALHLVYVVAVGGDVMPAARFFAPLMPILGLMAAISLHDFARGPGAVVLMVGVILAFNLAHSYANPHIHHQGKVGLHGTEVGIYLRDNLPPDTLLATSTAGSVAYWSRLPVIDMFGLTDEHIAHRDLNIGRGNPGHEKHDGKYVLDRKPGAIMFGSYGIEEPVFRGDHEIARDQRFQQYTKQSHRLPSGRRLFVYYRNVEEEEVKVEPPPTGRRGKAKANGDRGKAKRRR